MEMRGEPISLLLHKPSSGLGLSPQKLADVGNRDLA